MENTQDTQATEKMAQQYLKYKAGFKKECIFKTAASAAAILTIIFFLFIPLFLVQEKLNGVVLLERSFSLFDEIKNGLGSLGGGSSSEESIIAIFSIYQLFALVYLVAALILVGIGIFKNVTGILNLESYSLEEYDKIKRGDVKTRIQRFLNAPQLIFSAVMLEILYIIMRKYVAGMFSDMGAEEIGNQLFPEVGFANMTAVSGSIVIVIIALLAFIVLTVIAFNIRKKIKVAILKEDYGVAKAQ